MTTREAARRDFMIRECGCVVCAIRGLGYVPTEKHHQLTSGLHGNGRRKGEGATVGLCPWHHRGIAPAGYTRAQARALYGPSYTDHARDFRASYPDAVLLAKQEQLIETYRGSIIQ